MSTLFQLLQDGGILFTGPVFGLAIAVIILFFLSFDAVKNKLKVEKRIKLINSLGLLAVVYGVLGQLIGLIEAFDVIEASNGVSMALLAGGLKISSLPTVFGFVALLIARLGTTVLIALQKEEQDQIEDHL